MKYETRTMEKNIVIRTAKWALAMMKNKIVASLVMFIQGVFFLVLPNGDSTGTVRIAAVIVILAAIVNILIHLLSKERRMIDFILSLFNAVIIAAAVYCLIRPSMIEPYVRYLIGAFTMIVNLVNMIEVFKLEEKKNWRFVLGLAIGLFMLGLGFTMLIAEKYVIESMRRGIGVVLIINALLNIWYIFRLAISARFFKMKSK